MSKILCPKHSFCKCIPKKFCAYLTQTCKIRQFFKIIYSECFAVASPINRRNINLWNFPYCNFNIIESYSDFFFYTCQNYHHGKSSIICHSTSKILLSYWLYLPLCTLHTCDSFILQLKVSPLNLPTLSHP